MRNITIFAVSMVFTACLPAYVAEQMPNTDGERDIFSPAVAKSHVAAKANLMDCKPFARHGTQENEDAFARCTLVNERAQAQADLKAARAEIARLKATAVSKPRPPMASPFSSAPVGVMPAMFQPPHGASTRQPNDMAGVVHVFGTQGVAGNGARVCVFRGGVPVSVEVGGQFVPTLADIDGDNRVDGVYDCAPAIAGNVYIFDVQPGASAELVYVVAASHRPTEYRGVIYPGGYFVKSRGCRVYGYTQNSEAAATLCNHF